MSLSFAVRHRLKILAIAALVIALGLLIAPRVLSHEPAGATAQGEASADHQPL